MAFKPKTEDIEAAIRQTRVGLSEEDFSKTGRPKGAKRTVSPAPPSYEKKESYTMSFYPATRKIDLPELTRILGRKSDSDTLDYLIQRAKAIVNDPNFHKEQGSLFETF